MSFLIDTHAHLYLPEFDADRDKIVETALQSGVKKILLPNIDSSSIEGMNMLAVKFPDVCYPMMGLHPTSVKDNYKDELTMIREELNKGKYYGIGETGIDLYWDKTYFKEQCSAFSEQVELALQYMLPLVIHARESFAEIIDILSGYRNKGLTGVFHAFTGNTEIAEKVVDLGLKLGIGGILTYKNSGLPDVVSFFDLQHFVLETDSPFLAPVPMRGKRNESSYLDYVAGFVAQIKNTSKATVAEITTKNALQLFGLQ